MELKILKDKILVIRSARVMLDYDLAKLYGVETKVLKQAVRRNIDRFPEDFMFELTKEEQQFLRSQIVTSKIGVETRGGSRYAPFAFTEQGVAMLSSVLRSKKAIEVNIAIMRAFVMLRQYLSDYGDLKKQIKKLEKEMNKKFGDINEALNFLLEKEEFNEKQASRKQIGF